MRGVDWAKTDPAMATPKPSHNARRKRMTNLQGIVGRHGSQRGASLDVACDWYHCHSGTASTAKSASPSAAAASSSMYCRSTNALPRYTVPKA